MDISNLLEVLQTLMVETNFHCEWQLDWSERDDNIRINFQWELPNPDHLRIHDGEGGKQRGEVIYFETGVIFYNGDLMVPREDRYLKTIPVDSHLGIPFGEVVCTVRYLKRITSSMRLKWHEFLTNKDIKQLKIEWDDQAYEQMRDILIESNRYSETKVYLPSQKI